MSPYLRGRLVPKVPHECACPLLTAFFRRTGTLWACDDCGRTWRLHPWAIWTELPVDWRRRSERGEL